MRGRYCEDLRQCEKGKPCPAQCDPEACAAGALNLTALHDKVRD